MRLVILGATGSIGQSAFSVWQQHQDRVTIEGLVAHRNAERLWDMGCRMGAAWVALTDASAAADLERATRGRPGPEVIGGREAVRLRLAEAEATHVLAAMSGFAGLEPTLVALQRGMTVLLANKETLVAAGEVIVRALRAPGGGRIIPVDSEHSAIFQCLAGRQPFRRLILTCSGGPFRGWSRDALKDVTVEQALKHPNWQMGPKITIDSATLMNKGLEIIEAHYLFNVDYDAIDVVIHPESIVHSLVEFVDGATLAQCGYPDMRVPIQVALSWPERWSLDIPSFQWPGRTLHFEEPDLETFRLLALARQAGKAGHLYPCVLNAANEVAVEGFLARRLGFLEIAEVVEATLNAFAASNTEPDLSEVMAADAWARQFARERIAAEVR
ncbi:MAG: 1-deoxy-D-xylulose-5-phosphate reductoisomerase [Firmicutes bacterium]|nr:1-deoxy-D-xylulose-5-phosphate reductoisomerase [Bacillota bacterium]